MGQLLRGPLHTSRRPEQAVSSEKISVKPLFKMCILVILSVPWTTSFQPSRLCANWMPRASKREIEYLLDLTCCATLLSVAVGNVMTNSNLGKKGFIWFTCSNHSVPEGGLGRDSSRNIGRILGGTLLAGLPPWLAQLVYLKNPGTLLRVLPSILDLSLPHHL